jgi:hypothetical protein
MGSAQIKVTSEINHDSKMVSVLRFPLMAGVVVVHGGITDAFTKAAAMNGEAIHLPVTQYIENFLSHGICGICVPLFYIFSGYLFFHKGEWGLQTYLGKLRSRIRSLFVPYVLYSFSAILIIGLLQLLLPQLQSGAHTPIKDWQFWDYLHNGLWQYEHERAPFVGPLWFLRNLMIIVILSPLVYWFIIITRNYGIIALGLLYVWGDPSVPGVLDAFFFSWGAYYSIFKKSFTAEIGRFRHISWLALPLFLIDAATKDAGWNSYVHNIAILLGIILLISLVAALLSKRDIQPNQLLLSSTFFVFAIHEPYLDQVTKVITRMIHLPQSQILADFLSLVIYLLYDITVILVLVTLFVCIRKISPKLASILSGGR